MMFRFSGALLRFTDYQKEVAVDAPDVQGALDALCTQRPVLRQVLFDGEGHLRAAHRLFLNGEQIATAELRSGATPRLGPDDQLEVLTAIAGGR